MEGYGQSFVQILAVICECVSKGSELTAFEEEELMKKWQEILGASNEVVVSFLSVFCIREIVTVTKKNNTAVRG